MTTTHPKQKKYTSFILCLLLLFSVKSAFADNETTSFELPLTGATGYASISLKAYPTPKVGGKAVYRLAPGAAFTILQHSGNWFKIRRKGKEGYVRHLYVMINLPDVIPSIVYNNTNASKSILVSSGKELAGVTGQKLYNAEGFNERFQKHMFIMPALFGMAQKIQTAQRLALAQGNTLVIYEAFRSHNIQRKIVNSLAKLMAQDAIVRRGVSTPPWSKGWFVSQGTSNHQRGYAIDVHLAKVLSQEEKKMGSHSFTQITSYEEYAMPSAMHELSNKAAVFSFPVSSRTDTAWRKAKFAKSITSGAKLLQEYCTKAGLTPLASEWWHFNDLAQGMALGKYKSDGKFDPEPAVSEALQ